MSYRDGQVVDLITADVDCDEFENRVRKALNETMVVLPQTSDTAPTESPAYLPSSSILESSPTSTIPMASSSQAVSNPPSQQAPRMTEDSSEKQNEKSIQPVSKAKGKHRVEDDVTAVGTPQRAINTARDEVRKKKNEDKRELERIQAKIEADKTARRKQKEDDIVARQRLSETQHQATSTAEHSRRAPVTGKSINLQVRLFDGRTLRSSFPPTATLANDIRRWLESDLKSQPGTASFPPYSFKQIMAPHANREIDVSDEVKRLEQLDLYPSATLVLIPVSTYSEAYTSPGGHGILGHAYRGITGLSSISSSAFGAITSAMSAVTGYGSGQGQVPTQASAEQSAQTAEATPSRANDASTRVRTLADQRADNRNHNEQWYNGNQVSIYGSILFLK